MILVYIAVCIILSNKRRIFSFSSIQQIKHLLDTVSCTQVHAHIAGLVKVTQLQNTPTNFKQWANFINLLIKITNKFCQPIQTYHYLPA